VQRPLTSGPWEWPAGQTPLPAGPTLQPLVGWLCSDTLQEAVVGNPKRGGTKLLNCGKGVQVEGRRALTRRVSHLRKRETRSNYTCLAFN
jgi:hypothetical protein